MECTGDCGSARWSTGAAWPTWPAPPQPACNTCATHCHEPKVHQLCRGAACVRVCGEQHVVRLDVAVHNLRGHVCQPWVTRISQSGGRCGEQSLSRMDTQRVTRDYTESHVTRGVPHTGPAPQPLHISPCQLALYLSNAGCAEPHASTDRAVTHVARRRPQARCHPPVWARCAGRPAPLPRPGPSRTPAWGTRSAACRHPKRKDVTCPLASVRLGPVRSPL